MLLPCHVAEHEVVFEHVRTTLPFAMIMIHATPFASLADVSILMLPRPLTIAPFVGESIATVMTSGSVGDVNVLVQLLHQQGLLAIKLDNASYLGELVFMTFSNAPHDPHLV